MSAIKNSKIKSLEGLRGLMAWWVVIGHISIALGWTLPLINRNSLAVDVFIILSGFVIAGLIDRRNEAYLPYITRRVFRIFPLYLVALFASAALLHVQLVAWETLPQTGSNIGRASLAKYALSDFPTHLAVHLPLMQGLVPNDVLPLAPFTIIGQAWSVSLEFQFYLIAPAVMWTMRSRRRLPFLFLGLAGLLFLSPHFTDAFLGAKAFLFGVGICSFKLISNPHEYRIWLVTVIIMCFGAILRDGLWQLVPITIWFVVIIATKGPDGILSPIAGLLASRPLTHQGDISFSVYMVHMIPLYSSAAAIGAFGLEGTAKTGLIMAATIGGTYFLARCTFDWIEKPARDRGAMNARVRTH
jgi:peptidoglycan/LPS O-acetylase OafA/YrhL